MEEQQLDLRNVLGLIARRARLIISTVVLILALTTVVIFALKPVYTATTTILVNTTQKNVLDPSSQTTDYASDSARVDSEVELVRSPTTLLQVINENNLINDSEFGVKLGTVNSILAFLHIARPVLPTGDEALQSVMTNLGDAISVERVGVTYLLEVHVRSQNPATAAKLSDAVAKVYIEQQVKSKIDSTLAARNVIQNRIAESNAAVVASEEAIDEFISSNIDTIAAGAGRPDLADLQRQTAATLNEAKQLLTQANAAQQGIDAGQWQSVVDVLKSQAVASLETQRAALAQTLSTAVSGSTQEIDLRAQLKQIETNLKSAADTELGALRNQVATDQSKASALRDQLRSAVLQSNLPATVLTNFYALQQNSSNARNLYQTLLSRQKELDEQAYLQVADSRIVSQALPPNTPSFPNPRLIISVTALAALALSVGLAFLYENYIGGFASSEQLSAVAKLRVVSAVAKQTARRGDQDASLSIADTVALAPLSTFAESIRRARLGIDQSIQHRRDAGEGLPESTVVMVSSATPNEGKTTIALSLARAYALSGQRTLLVDCDLRKPSLHTEIGVEPSIDLIDYLRNPSADHGLQDVLGTDPLSGASVIFGGRRSEVATDKLVNSRAFDTLIERVRHQFDVIVLDTPPVDPVVDGLYMARHADSVLFVVRWAVTSQQTTKSAVSALKESVRPGVEVVALLNQQSRAESRYYKRYGDYYVEG